MGVDEDLTLGERKARWKLIERARLERARGKSVILTNRRVWVNGKGWRWDLERESWYEDAGESEEESEN